MGDRGRLCIMGWPAQSGKRLLLLLLLPLRCLVYRLQRLVLRLLPGRIAVLLRRAGLARKLLRLRCSLCRWARRPGGGLAVLVAFFGQSITPKFSGIICQSIEMRSAAPSRVKLY